MARHGKTYNKVKEAAPKEVLELDKAVGFLKANSKAKFDETVELCVRLGADPKKSDQSVRGTVKLPNGSGKNVRVVVFAAGPAADAARAAGADEVGNEDLIEKVKGGWADFDVAIATPDAMKEVRKLGKVLGPRGLMPNPKTGTVTDDTAEAVRESKGGRVEFRMDKNGNVNVPVGKISFEVKALCENIEVVVAALRAEKPVGSKGTYLKRVTVASTMGVGLQVNIRD